MHSRSCLRYQRHAPRILRSAIFPKTAPMTAPLRTALSPAVPAHYHGRPAARPFHYSHSNLKQKAKSGEKQPTNISDLDVLGSVPVPSTSVDVCMYDGFGLNSGITIDGGDGALLVNGEAFRWRPWEAIGEKTLVNKKGQFELPEESLGVFDTLWPRPDLLIIGVGKMNLPLSPKTKEVISDMGLRVEVLDTRNGAAQFNLLATERGVSEVAAALIPIGWKEGEGVVA